MKCDFCGREDVEFTLYEKVCDHCAKAMEIMSRSIVYRDVLQMLIAEGWRYVGKEPVKSCDIGAGG